MNGQTAQLIRAELTLIRRDPLVLTFVFVFPIVTMLIIGVRFGTTLTAAFEFTDPSHRYAASLPHRGDRCDRPVMVPVHLASYRERGVLLAVRGGRVPRALAVCPRRAGDGR